MNQELRTALPILLSAMGVSAIVWLLAWRPWRRTAGSANDLWSGPIALGLGFLAAFAVLTRWRGVQLQERWHWIAPIALAAMAIGVIAASWRRNSAIKSIAAASAAAIVSGALVHPPPIAVHPMWWRIGLGVLVLAMWGLAEPLAQRHRGAIMPLAWVIVLSGLSIVLLQSRQAGFSLLAAAMAAMCGIAMVIGIIRRDFSFSRGGMYVIAAIFATLVIIGWLYNISDVSIVPFALVVIAPGALWLGELKFVRDRSRWQRTLIRIVLIAVPIAIAMALAIRAAGVDEEAF